MIKFSGVLDDYFLLNFLQIQHAASRSGDLRFEGAGLKGKVALRSGEVVHARFGGLTGEAALWALLSQSEGRFQYDSCDANVEPNISLRTLALFTQTSLMLEKEPA